MQWMKPKATSKCVAPPLVPSGSVTRVCHLESRLEIQFWKSSFFSLFQISGLMAHVLLSTNELTSGWTGDELVCA